MEFVTAQGLAEKSKYSIVIAFVVAAVLTSPDPVSQIGLALPAILLYEISIHMARLVERRRAADALQRDAAQSQEETSEEVGSAKG
ncbi:Sec-independent protein translocase protein TatC [compost metagenome]